MTCPAELTTTWLCRCSESLKRSAIVMQLVPKNFTGYFDSFRPTLRTRFSVPSRGLFPTFRALELLAAFDTADLVALGDVDPGLSVANPVLRANDRGVDIAHETETETIFGTEFMGATVAAI